MAPFPRKSEGGCLTRGSLFYYKERQIITQADSVMESACGV